VTATKVLRVPAPAGATPGATDAQLWGEASALAVASTRTDTSALAETSLLDAGFVIGTTRPALTNPLNPTAADNVGAAFGWNGKTLTVVTSDYTIPSGTTVRDTWFQCFVTFTDATSVADNCVFTGRVPGGTFKAGFASGGSGGTLTRCTFYGQPTTTPYYMDGLESTGGTWTFTRCSIQRVVDSVHTNGGIIKLFGCQIGPYGFHDDDANHTGDSVHPWWSHGDCLQRLTGATAPDVIQGCDLRGFFDTRGVGGTSGNYTNGTNTTVGNPAAAMNGNGKDSTGAYLGVGSTTAYENANYANVLSYTNVGGYTGMLIDSNWINGGSYPSGLIQLTNGTGASLTITNNRWGLGGRSGGGGNTIFLVSYPSDTVCTHTSAGTETNYFDPADPDVIANGLANVKLTWTSGGAKITGIPPA
jgi:hypothetical protein